jgi:CRP-like cAMP-binding protein
MNFHHFFYSCPSRFDSPSFNHNFFHILGAVIVKEGERNDKFYVLNDGNAQMLKRNAVVGERITGNITLFLFT